MIHSLIVPTHQQEASHARVLLDTLGMDLQKRVLVSKTWLCPNSCSPFADFPCYLDIDECAMNTDNCDDTFAECANTQAGSFTCTCIAGYTGDGTTGTCIGG